MDNYIINPVSGRPILYNGAIHRQLLRTNQIKPIIIEKKPINIKPIDKKQTKTNSSTSEPYNSDNESDNESDNNDNIDNTDLQELFNSLNDRGSAPE